MKHRSRTLALAMVFMLGCGAAAADEAASPAVVKVKKVAGRVHHAIVRGANAAARGVKRGTRAATHGMKAGVDAAARGIETGAKATARAADAVAEKVNPEAP